MRKTLIFLVLFVAAASWCLFAADDSNEKQSARQAYISKAKDLNEQLNRLGAVMVRDIYDGLKGIEDRQSKTPGFENRKLKVLVLFNRLSPEGPFRLDEFRIPVRLEIYQQLTYALARAARQISEKNTGDKTGEKSGNVTPVDFLYYDVQKLKNVLQNPRVNFVDKSNRRLLGLYKKENAVLEIILSINREDKKVTVGGRLYAVESGVLLASSGNYRITAGTIITRYPAPDWTRIFNGDLGKPPKGVDNQKEKMITVSKIMYLPPGANETVDIKNGGDVHSGGKIWFEVTVKEPGGYFLALLRDSQKKVLNVFPGTRNAVLNGDYKIPDCLSIPRTTVQKIVVENQDYFNKINKNNTINNTSGPGKPGKYQTFTLGGYTFDNNPGLETLIFFYSGKRKPELEIAVKEAAEIGMDLRPVKGVKQWTSPLVYKSFTHYEVLRLHFVHKSGFLFKK